VFERYPASTIATAAKQIVTDRMDVVAAGGQDSISMVQTPEMRIAPDPSLIAMHKHVYMPMLQTAETVARRYGISRERQDEYIGTLVNAYLARGGQALGVKIGQSYVDVGTFNGYRAATALLASIASADLHSAPSEIDDRIVAR